MSAQSNQCLFGPCHWEKKQNKKNVQVRIHYLLKLIPVCLCFCWRLPWPWKVWKVQCNCQGKSVTNNWSTNLPCCKIHLRNAVMASMSHANDSSIRLKSVSPIRGSNAALNSSFISIAAVSDFSFYFGFAFLRRLLMSTCMCGDEHFDMCPLHVIWIFFLQNVWDRETDINL